MTTSNHLFTFIVHFDGEQRVFQFPGPDPKHALLAYLQTHQEVLTENEYSAEEFGDLISYLEATGEIQFAFEGIENCVSVWRESWVLGPANKQILMVAVRTAS